MVEILFWLTLNCFVIAPIYLLMRYIRNNAFLPVILYGLSLWIFLVAGLPLDSERLNRGMNYNMTYYWVIIAASMPLYGFVVLGMNRSLFPRCKPMLGLGDIARSNSAIKTFVVMWLVICCAVGMYIVRYGKPPIFNITIFELVGAAQELKDIRKASTYTEEFRTYKFFFYSAPPLAALVGYYLYQIKKISFLANALSVLLAMLLTVAFLHKQGPAYIVLELLLLHVLLKKPDWMRITKGIAIAAGCLLSVFLFFYGLDRPIIEVVFLLLKRISGGYFFMLEFGLDNFPSPYVFFNGNTLPNPAGLFHFDQIDLSGFTMWHLNGRTIGNAPMPAAGEFYVNFGIIGIMLFLALLSSWLFFLVYIYYPLRRNIIGICMWVVLALKAIACNMQSLFSMVDIDIILFGIIFIMIDKILFKIGRSIVANRASAC